MERPAKRQKLSPDLLSPCPTRTLDLAALQRVQPQRRTPGRVILPRIPDVTVTAGVLEVAVNDGSTGTEIPVPTAEVAVSLGTLGTVTLPGLAPSWPSSSSASQSSGQSTMSVSNSSITTTEKTVTVTATSIFHVSYTNGTFIAPSRTRTTSATDSEDTNTIDSDSSTFTYLFGQGVTDTYTPSTADSTGGLYNAAVVGATATSPSSAPTRTNSGGGAGGPSGPVLTPQQTQMVGGIVGGVAGTALILVVLLYVLRWYRQRLKSQGRLPEQLSSGHNSRDFGNLGLVGSVAARSQSSKSLFFPPAAMVSAKYPHSGSDITMMTSTPSTSGADSEKGFHRVSGRKIAPVLSTGGDQYGGSFGAFEKDMAQLQTRAITRPRPDLSESSFYRDDEGAYVGDGTPASRSASTTPIYPFAEKTTHPPGLAHMASTSTHDFVGKDLNNTLACNTSKPEGVAVYRSSPARTPVTQSPNTSSIQLPIQAPVTMDEDIPEMPLPSPGIHLGLPARQRRPSLLSSSSGRFKEEI